MSLRGITYFCTDKHGHTYSRYSAGHLVPLYTHARVQSRADGGPVGKWAVSYASRRELAQAQSQPGDEVVSVRAYPGRHKQEPTSSAATL